MVNQRNHIFHRFCVENVPKIKKCATFIMGTLFFNILHSIVLLDHVYSACLLNVATNTKNKPFSGCGPWPMVAVKLVDYIVHEILLLFAMVKLVVKSFKVPVVEVAELTNRFHWNLPSISRRRGS